MNVRIEWDLNTESDIDKYYIYRQVVETGEITKIDEVDHPTHDYEDLNGNSNYRYFVSAVDNAGNESPMAGPVRLPPSADTCYVYDSFRTAHDQPAAGIKISIQISSLPYDYKGYFWSGQEVQIITDAQGNWGLYLPKNATVKFICSDFGIEGDSIKIPDQTSIRFGDIK
jgi:hypothetical protein